MEATATLTTPWNQTDKEQAALALLEALTLMGQEHSDQTLTLMLDRLSRYPVEHVIRSLKQCETRCRRIYLADIIDNLPRRRQPIM
jgi:hypothetical protein